MPSREQHRKLGLSGIRYHLDAAAKHAKKGECAQALHRYRDAGREMGHAEVYSAEPDSITGWAIAHGVPYGAFDKAERAIASCLRAARKR